MMTHVGSGGCRYERTNLLRMHLSQMRHRRRVGVVVRHGHVVVHAIVDEVR